MILDKGKHPHPRCNMLVPWGVQNGRHPSTPLCRRGEKRKRWSLETEEAQATEDMAFKAYGHSLTMILSLKYRMRVISSSDDYWPAVTANLQMDWNKWYRISQILCREGGAVRDPNARFH